MWMLRFSVVQHMGSLQNAPTSIVKSLELLVVTISLACKSGAHPGHKNDPAKSNVVLCPGLANVD